MAEKATGTLLDADYLLGEKSVIRLHFSTKKGKLALKDPGFEPYFYALPAGDAKEAADKLSESELNGVKPKRVEIVEKRVSPEKEPEKALKIIFNSTKDVKDARDKVKELPFVLHKREFDIPFSKRYLIDRDLQPLCEYEVEFDREKMELKKIKKKSDKTPALKIGAFDLETSHEGSFSNPEKDPIIMASYVDHEEQAVWSTKKIRKKYAVQVKDEKELVEKLVEKISSKNLDILCTYNGDSFDFPYLKERAKRLGLKETLRAGGLDPRLLRKGLDNAASLQGTQHVDAYQLLRVLSRFAIVNLIKFDLESVDKALFGEEKEKIQAEQMIEWWNAGKELERIAEYNRRDSEVTYRIVDEYLPLFVEIGKLVHQVLFDVTRSSAGQLVEALLMIKSHRQGVLVPNRPGEQEVKSRLVQSIKGGFVREPLPGLHEDIAVMDFTSLHPTIMISHNISPDTVNCGHAECKKNASPVKHWFCTKRKGFLSSILEEIFDRRVKLKKELKKLEKGSREHTIVNARQQALKILLNSFFGTLAFARFRWYSRESAAAITGWSRQYVQMVAEKAEEAGFETLYGDSITAERFVTVMDKDWRIGIINIAELFKKSRPAGKRNGKSIRKPNGLMALSINPKTLKPEWQKIKEVIAHRAGKKIFRVNQKFGETRVTEDHSLLVREGKRLVETTPGELKRPVFKAERIPGTKLLKEIDLYKELEDYHYETLCKNRIKISQLHKNNKFIWFGWRKQKNAVKAKRFIRVGSKEFSALCRLLGAYIAEGSSSTIETTSSKFGASISSSNEQWLKGLKKDYHCLFKNAKTAIIDSMKGERRLEYESHGKKKVIVYKDKTKKLQMMNSLSAVLFRQLCGQKSTGKRLPSFIFNVGAKYKRLLLKKYVEGDGHRTRDERYSARYKKKHFRIATSSLGLVSGLSLLLTQLKTKHTIAYRKEKDAYSIQTSDRYNTRLETRVKKENYNSPVFDLSVEKNNNFVDACGQILLHNTDSAFLKIPGGKTKKDVEGFLKKINSELPGVMNLELEGFYKRGIFVTKKSGAEAAKKRYALIDYDGNLKIVGFEYVRRDWSKIAKETQRSVIEAVLSEGKPDKAVKIVKEKIGKLKAGKVKKSDLVIFSQLRRPVDKYESIGPHIAAAKKAIAKGKALGEGSVIGYIITRAGKSISDKAQLEEFVAEGNYDAEYYIGHQVLPAVIKIIRELGYSKEDLIHGGKQSSLGAFG